ncbi:AAA family ATPase [Enterovirga rhinocerotis]|uniref:AAA family ATPase n=1 Tax=Enterovirga rhinocerotis TaxID=1339210 RepID=UPI001414CD3E|nr:AAA family ATPase [Enterovirga rhinocerotis]
MALRPTRHRPVNAGPATSITIVCGPPGAGKSSYVERHRRHADLVVDVDALYHALTLDEGRWKPEAIRPFVLAARDAVLARLERAQAELRAAWIITCGENLTLRQQLRDRLGARVVILPTPAAECIARMRRQGRPPDHIREMVSVCERWHRGFVVLPGEEIVD